MSDRTAETVPMDERTLTALQKSIAHWQRVVDGSEIATGSDECELCKEFYPENLKEFDSERPPNDCKGCPVDTHTKGAGCVGTPCCSYFWSMECNRPEEAHGHAVTELGFLKSLLPGQAP